MHRKVIPSDLRTWKMYRSWEKQSLESESGGSFSRIRRAMAPTLPVTAANSASTTVPLATTAYRIAISLSSRSPCAGAFIAGGVDYTYLITLLLLWPTMSSYPSTMFAVLAWGIGDFKWCGGRSVRVNSIEQEPGDCDIARVDQIEQELGNYDIARVDPTEQELRNSDVARVDLTEQELGNCDVASRSDRAGARKL
ncbi:hypothetical protein BHM03_00011434 [Ensete ventricosum]|nr:hypothetical protein BHM03_00011434 [Ensete ventricosum]